MKQILQSYKTGKLTLADVPAPVVDVAHVLVRTTASLVSIGTERATMAIAKKSLIGKASERPDLVRKLIAKASRDGIVSAIESARRKLDQPIPLGYSCAGEVIAVGEGVAGFTPGMRVACAGAKVANHAEVNLVPMNLCAPVPDGVDDEAAAFVTVGAIALQGLRQAQPTLGESFAVIGLGLIGQILVQLLKANGCLVLGIDLDPKKVALAQSLGADDAVRRTDDVKARVDALTGGRGVDGVIITAATASNDPIQLAGELCRDRGRVVAVGAVGMDVPRRPYYDKELTLAQSRSYGPGRYDPVYEELGMDYPIGYVRWTEQRNMDAFLRACAGGQVRLAPLVSHRFAIDDAERAYEIVENAGDALGILLTYPKPANGARAFTQTIDIDAGAPQKVAGSARATDPQFRVSFVGAGAFATGVLVPALAKIPDVRLDLVASARGFSARHIAEQFHFRACTTDFDQLLGNNIDGVFIATRHNLHAAQVTAALAADKHVFVEKPLCLDESQLQSIESACARSQRLLMVGYNRRFAPLAVELDAFFAQRRGPMVIDYRVNAGTLPADSWIHDPAVGGGRIIGEVCHFVDFASFLAHALPVEVYARGVGPSAGARADENVTISVAYGDGSLATITYVAVGDPASGKERVEVFADGASACLDDFRSLNLFRDGKQRLVQKLAQDKGHEAELKAFVRAARRGGEPPITLASLLSTSRATFAAVESLRAGRPLRLDQPA